ncbi:hypothetical protein [Fibrobacter sp. UWH5]|uniref:hypothetical protein n=1 Tax=Fibrobacter sp. UWH5 TaxID=1896211 RepID=UPI0011148E07|nr:hypothetical protein [Fibrobacter sp. UWH5]
MADLDIEKSFSNCPDVKGMKFLGIIFGALEKPIFLEEWEKGAKPAAKKPAEKKVTAKKGNSKEIDCCETKNRKKEIMA